MPTDSEIAEFRQRVKSHFEHKLENARLRQRVSADDLTQDSLTRLAKRINDPEFSFSDPTFKKQLPTILRNVYVDVFRFHFGARRGVARQDGEDFEKGRNRQPGRSKRDPRLELRGGGSGEGTVSAIINRFFGQDRTPSSNVAYPDLMEHIEKFVRNLTTISNLKAQTVDSAGKKYIAITPNLRIAKSPVAGHDRKFMKRLRAFVTGQGYHWG